MKIPKKPNKIRTPFYWWRRFKTHQFLPYKESLLNKIENGDFEYSPFFEQAKWELHWMKEEQEEFIKNYFGENVMNDILYIDIEKRARKRYNRLYEDGMNDESDRMDQLTKGLAREFEIKVSKVKDIMSEFGNTTKKLYFHIANIEGINVDTLNKLKEFGKN